MATRNTNIVVPKLEKGVIGGDIDRWGYKWNENIDKLSEFHTKVIADSEMQNQELARLENEKLNIEDIPSKVEPVVQEFLETTIKPEIDDYIDTVSKPDITKHVETKKQEINTYVNTTSKPALDSYEKEKEKELNTYTTTKKGELDSHTIAKKGELDAYEKTKETQLNNYTGTKQTQLDSYTNTKKGELDTHTTAKEGQLDTYTTGKERELDTHTAEKKSELDVYEKTKEGELNTFTGTKKTEITNHTNTKKGELDTYTTQKKGEITTHTDSEIERINADSELAKKQNITDSRLQTESKEIVGAINESLWNIGYKDLGTVNDFNELTQSGVFFGRAEVGTLNSPYTPPFNFILINYNRSGLIEQTIITGVDDIVVRRQLGTRWRNWEKTLRTNTKEFLGNAGISSIVYIQDSGTKTKDNGYIDKSTGQVYLCLETNTDTTITDKFMSITNVELGKKINKTVNDKVSKSGDKMTGALYVPKNSGLIVGENSLDSMGNTYETRISSESGYSMIWRASRTPTKASEFLGIRHDSEPIFRQDTKDGSGQWNDNVLYHSGNLPIVDNLTTADKSKVLSANMGVKLNTSGYDGQGRGTLRNNSLNIDQIKKSGAWYIYDKNLKPFIGFDYAYLQHIQYNDNDVGAWQLMCPDNKLELYTRVCAGRSGRYTDWEQILTSNNKLFLGNAGVSKIIYIQDAGEKTAGNGYVDKTTGQLYLCKVTTTDTSVTDKFLLATNIENRDRISVIEEKLGIYHPVGKISTISVSRDENSSSPILSFSSL